MKCTRTVSLAQHASSGYWNTDLYTGCGIPNSLPSVGHEVYFRIDTKRPNGIRLGIITNRDLADVLWI